MGRRGKRRRTENNNNGGEEDRLSSLPDDVIGDILSLLPTQSAVATSVLSRRWRCLWTHITSLDVDSLYFQRRRSNFFTVIGKILRKLSSLLIRRFRLCIWCPRSTTLKISTKRYSSKLDSWFRQLCGRNVQEIDIWTKQVMRPFTRVVPPPCIFQTQSLVVLKLDELFDFKLPDDVEINLPNLKILGMSLIHDSHYELMPKLVRSCTLLEHLYLVEPYKGFIRSPLCVRISAQNLKRLSIERFGSRMNGEVVIDTPKLESLYIEGCAWIRYSFVNNPIGLLEAEVDIQRYGESGETTFTMELFEAISIVRSLTLYPAELHAMTMFTNLTHFRMTLYTPRGFKELMALLKFFPILEFLTLHLVASYGELSWNPSDSVPTCLLTHVKRLEINFEDLEHYKDRVMPLVKHMLITAEVLERLVLIFNSKIYQHRSIYVQRRVEYEFGKELYECPRRSSLCQIEFYGMCLKMLGKGSKVRGLNGHMLSFT